MASNDIDYLLLLVDSKGGDTENATTITETYLADWDKVKNGWDMVYPSYGCKYRGYDFSGVNCPDLYCTNIQYSRENKKFYSALSGYSQFSGKDCITVEATYSVNFTTPQDKFTKRISGSGYKTFKMSAGGAKWRYTMEDESVLVTDRKSLPCALNQEEFEYKVPISQIDLKTNFIGTIDEVAYDLYRNTVNATPFLGRARGCVLFDSYTITPRFTGDIDSPVSETELTLTFKCLPFDWNWEFRSKVQAVNMYDKKKCWWQNDDRMSDRFDYIYDYNEINQQIQADNQANGTNDPLVTPYDCYLYDCIKSVTIGSNEQIAITYMTYDEIKEYLAALPMWSGSLCREKNPEWTGAEDTTHPRWIYRRVGAWELGEEGWDARYWLKNPAEGDYLENRQYLYSYADLNNLLTGFPVVNVYNSQDNPNIPPIPPTDDDEEEPEVVENNEEVE